MQLAVNDWFGWSASNGPITSTGMVRRPTLNVPWLTLHADTRRRRRAGFDSAAPVNHFEVNRSTCRQYNHPTTGNSDDSRVRMERIGAHQLDGARMAREIKQSGSTPASAEPAPATVPVPQVLGEHVCFLLGTVSARAIELFGQELAGAKLSVRAAGMLLLLDAQGPTSQHVIGQQMRLERSTMSLAADELERNRLVRRRRAPADRRHNELELTARGRRAIEEIKIATDKTTDALLRQLAPDEQRQLVALLHRIL
jgi:MarR family transcriptional regulator, lower aerobic nicotinate degradation pathway regulator